MTISLIKNNPIGVFDSGIGGLTITSSLVKNLPNESIIFPIKLFLNPAIFYLIP
jgi:hypothetical protein